MRRLVVLAIAVALAPSLWVGMASPGVGAEDWGLCQQGRTGNGYKCLWGTEATRPGGAGSGTTGSSSTGPGNGDAPPVAYVDEAATGPDGKACLERRAVSLPDSSTISAGTNLGTSGNVPIMANYPRCPARPASPGAAVDPVALARQGWEEVSLPAPRPYIAPGWAITGKAAYLETRGSLSSTFTKGTPVGALHIASTARYYVDWGDGSQTGPYSMEGGPWPDGQVTHVYTDVGRYQVVVTAEWTATWQLGPNRGWLSGQRTTGTIPDLPVEQIQAVVSSG